MRAATMARWLMVLLLALSACGCGGAEAPPSAAQPGALLPPPPRPFGTQPLRDYGTLALTFLFGGAAVASGVGGGAVYVPLFDAVLGLGVKRAAALSQVAISCGALAGVAVLLTRTHPADPASPLIDLELAPVLTPSVLLGSSLGVLANLLLPSWLLTALLLVLLIAVSLSTALKGRALRRLATEGKKERAAAARKVEEEAANLPSTPPPTLPGAPPPLHHREWGDSAT